MCRSRRFHDETLPLNIVRKQGGKRSNPRSASSGVASPPGHLGTGRVELMRPVRLGTPSDASMAASRTSPAAEVNSRTRVPVFRFTADQFAPFPVQHSAQLFRGYRQISHDIVVEHHLAATRERTHRVLLVPGYSQFPHESFTEFASSGCIWADLIVSFPATAVTGPKVLHPARRGRALRGRSGAGGLLRAPRDPGGLDE